MRITRIFIFELCLILVLNGVGGLGVSFASAQEALTNAPVSRGYTVYRVVKDLGVEVSKQSFISSCLSHLSDCFFVFSVKSRFNGMSLTPLILYPDVFPAHPFYKEINIASMLGVVEGYIEMKNSPFEPQAKVTKIEAMKIILGAAGLIEWKDKFELVGTNGASLSQGDFSGLTMADLNAKGDEWWYARYLQAAAENCLINSGNLSSDLSAWNGTLIEADLNRWIDSAKKAKNVPNTCKNDSRNIQPGVATK